MPRSFSEHEKENIRKKLIAACTDSWTQYGYKKTSVDELCQRVSISKGAFYLFFDSKEALFCEVICSVQERIYDSASELIYAKPNRNGVVDALRYLYREYDRNNFLHDSSSADYITLTNRLLPDQLEKIQSLEHKNRMLFLDIPHLHRKLPEQLTVSIIYSLLMGVKQKDIMPNHIEVFDFLAEHIIDDLYE